MFYMDPTYLLLFAVTVGLGFVTQGYINSTYRKWSQVPISARLNGADVARRILDSEGLTHVGIQAVPGNLTDHYDPRSKMLGLSQGVGNGASVASAGVAAHEAGHAIQDARGYVWGNVRTALVPAANLGSQASWILIIAGFMFQVSGLVWAGILFYAFAVLFQIVTLPVELDASRRAMGALSTSGYLTEEQLAGARQVLTAAALTYVAAALISVLNLLYYIGLARGRD